MREGDSFRKKNPPPVPTPRKRLLDISWIQEIRCFPSERWGMDHIGVILCPIWRMSIRK